LSSFTVDSPIPYEISGVIALFDEKNKEMVPGSGNKEKQGPYFGKLARFIQRLSSKI